MSHLHGRAHAVVDGWNVAEVRGIATEVLCAAASNEDKLAHQIVAGILSPDDEHPLDADDYPRPRGHVAVGAAEGRSGKKRLVGQAMSRRACRPSRSILVSRGKALLK